MEIPKIEDLNASNCREVSIKIHYPEFHQYLLSTYPDYEWKVKMGLYYHKLSEPPVCVVCGKPVRFIDFKHGWYRTCCSKCAQLDPQTIQKKKQTMLKNYGIENPMQSEELREKIKQTCLEKYGTTNGGWSKQAQEKIKKSNLKKYGVEFPMQSEELREKIKQTCLEKYGVEYTGRVKNGATVFQKYENLIEILDNNVWRIKCSNKNCNKCIEKYFDIDSSTYVGRLRLNTEPCIKLNKFHSPISSLELKVQSWLDEWNIEYETGNRTVIGPKELDIWIPSKNIAIEINGCYWHSDQEKPKNYHINKFKDCQQKGIQLIQVWEDWMIKKEDIVKSFLQAKLGICDNTIYARKCDVREIEAKEANQFLNENHIQGKCNSNYRLGLFYNDKLVAVMCFSKRSALSGPKKLNNKEAELIRFCNLRGYRVVGGASKLLKYYIKLFSPDIITSYSANDISNGQLYGTLRFKTDHKISESYWYIEPDTYKREHRSIYTRSGIVRKWPEYDINDKSWTERSVMDLKGYNRIYDAGTTKWTLKLKQ